MHLFYQKGVQAFLSQHGCTCSFNTIWVCIQLHRHKSMQSQYHYPNPSIYIMYHYHYLSLVILQILTISTHPVPNHYPYPPALIRYDYPYHHSSCVTIPTHQHSSRMIIPIITHPVSLSLPTSTHQLSFSLPFSTHPVPVCSGLGYHYPYKQGSLCKGRKYKISGIPQTGVLCLRLAYSAFPMHGGWSSCGHTYCERIDNYRFDHSYPFCIITLIRQHSPCNIIIFILTHQLVLTLSLSQYCLHPYPSTNTLSLSQHPLYPYPPTSTH